MPNTGERQIQGQIGATKSLSARGHSPWGTRRSARTRKMRIGSLERGLEEARSGLCVIDLEPGMGKSRLLHELRQRIGRELAFVLSGSCSPGGRHTRFFRSSKSVGRLDRAAIGLFDQNREDDKDTTLRCDASGYEDKLQWRLGYGDTPRDACTSHIVRSARR
jgi:hypothetical protein